ncbi:MAG: hypothetical protein ACFCUU_15920 [Cyclobacteriaceae bacterium]
MKNLIKASLILSVMFLTIKVMAVGNDLSDKELTDEQNEEAQLEMLETFIENETTDRDTLVSNGDITIMDKKHGVIAKGNEDNLVIQKLRPVADLLFQKGNDCYYMIVPE